MTAFNSKRKHENSAVAVDVPKTSKNLPISRCCFAEDSKESTKIYNVRAQRLILIGSLSTNVFETRTATGSELISLLSRPHTTTFALLSIFSPLEMSSIKIWETIRSYYVKCSLPIAVRVSKSRVLKLPNIVLLI